MTSSAGGGIILLSLVLLLLLQPAIADVVGVVVGEIASRHDHCIVRVGQSISEILYIYIFRLGSYLV